MAKIDAVVLLVWMPTPKYEPDKPSIDSSINATAWASLPCPRFRSSYDNTVACCANASSVAATGPLPRPFTYRCFP